MKRFIIFIALFFCLSINVLSQVVDFKGVSMQRHVQILQAEDELRYDKTLEKFMKHPNPFLRKRAALAAGRIGNKAAIPMLEKLLAKDTEDVRQMAAFALGEIESIKATDAILNVLNSVKNPASVRARAIEAAGKIAAKNKEDEKAKLLSKAILDNLKFEANRRSRPDKQVILLGLTAALRAKPENADEVVAKFLTFSDWRIRADAANILARLRAKTAGEMLRKLLVTDKHPIVRANAARALALSEDKAIDLITKSAILDKDLRVRINAIRALGSLKDKKSADALLERAEELFVEYKKSKYENPPVENELLTIATALGRILQGTDNARAIKFLQTFRIAEKHISPEVEVALVRVSPKAFAAFSNSYDWKSRVGVTAGINEAFISKKIDDSFMLKVAIIVFVKAYVQATNTNTKRIDKSFPSILRAYAKLKEEDSISNFLRFLKTEDVIVRSTAANLLGDVKPKDAEEAAMIYRDLSSALWKARTDKLNDASLAILDALKKQYENRPKKQTVKIPYMTPFISAMSSPDYLIRRKAAEIYRGFEIKKPDPLKVSNPDFKPFIIPKDIEVLKFWKEKDKNGARSRVKRANYRKALSRKNGEWGAVLQTEKGKFMIRFFPEEAPLTVDNFINLANSGYFNGLAIHRVVPNFVVQDGDNRGDGSGGPGWQIRCEINQIPYKRGMVGMALSGKDTGGSQWFVTHSPQPHLDGGYTIFGKVNENDMKIVDKLARGDKIISVNIVRFAPEDRSGN